MAKHLSQAFAFDIHTRQTAPDPLPAKGVQIDTKESSRAKYTMMV
jgi:hypothetical protein